MSAAEAFWAAPPIARTLTAATLGLSIAVHAHILNGYWVVFWPGAVFTFPPQLWRLVSCFLVTGGGISIIFDTYFIWTNCKKLETASPRLSKPGDFFMYLVFVCTIILGLNMLLTGSVVFTSALILALSYTSAQDDRGSVVSFMVVQIPAQWAPLAMLAMTLVMAGPEAALSQSTGLIAAHLFEFLTKIYPELGGGPNLIATPEFVTRLFSPSGGPARTPAGANIRSGGGSATTTGSSGPLPDSWRSRGSGHRLGGD